MLPCEGCRQNYTNHIKLNPLNDEHLHSRDNIINWWVSIHNLTRKSMNKEQFNTVKFLDYYYRAYTNGYTKYTIKELETEVKNDNYMNLVYIILLIFLIIAFKKFISKK